MFDSRLYREACRELRAPEEKVEEIVTMSQQNHTKSRRPVRAVLIAAAAAALMAGGVSAANPQEEKIPLPRHYSLLFLRIHTEGMDIDPLQVGALQLDDAHFRAALSHKGLKGPSVFVDHADELREPLIAPGVGDLRALIGQSV